jgi:hypothetical protein
MQTSIDWLQQKYDNCPESFLTDEDFEKAKEMHKQEIIDAKDGLYQDTSHRGYPRPDDIDKFEQDAWDNYEHVEGNLYSTTFRNAFKLGYNKAKEKYKYTDEDLLGFYEFYMNGNERYVIDALKEYFQSLKQHKKD